jgi:PAS domain S-box-containing protein
LLLYQQTNGRRRAEQLAQDMTVDLTRLAQVVKHTANAVLIGDREGRITWINEGFSRMTGYSAAEAIGKTAGELVGSGKADAKTLEILAETVANGTSCRVEILNRAKGGREYWTEIELQPQRDAKGAVIGFMEVGTDITQRRQVEAEAIRHWELLRGSIDALDEAFVLYDPQGRLVLCNEKYKQVYQNVAHLMVPGARFLDIIRAGAEMGQYATAVGRIDAWVTERLAAHLSGNSDLIQRHTNGRT